MHGIPYKPNCVDFICCSRALTVRDEHHDGGREDADADEEVCEAEGEDELVGDGAQLRRRQHRDDDQSVPQLQNT